jgi:hypothetical protein
VRQIALQRHGKASFKQRAKWALYDEKRFRRLIEDFTELVDKLVELFPGSQRAQEELCEQEVLVIRTNEELSLLNEVTAQQDKLLAAAFDR